MDDLTLRYFDAEMRYLREAAKAFAQAHPDRAAMLDLDKAGTPDPYVERLFEGFAFSVGRLREKIDDDLPELTEGLVSMLWPHYLRTIPSLSIVALTPTLPAMKMAETVPAGFEISSRPLGPKNTVCRYRTTRDLTLNPLAIEEAVMTAEPDGRSALRLRFACSELADWSQTDLRRLALYLGEDAVTGSALHLWLTRSQAALYLRLPGQTERVSLDGYFSPGGFSEEDRLWPKGESAFSGYQLLLEYFTFREKFMFVQLNGLENITLPAGISHFTLEVVFSEVWQSDLPVSASSLRLHCVPVINLFTLEADPLTISGLESEYLLRPKRLQDGHTEIYSVDSVTGSGRTGEARYVPFTRFRHQGGMMRRHAPATTTPASNGASPACTIPGLSSADSNGRLTGRWRGKRSPCASPALTASCRAGRYRARCWIAVSRYQPRRLPSAISVSPHCRYIPRRKTATTGGS